jgi:hypothetical protein
VYLGTPYAFNKTKFTYKKKFICMIYSLLLQTTGVRCLTFNPDGRTLLCGLHESLKVSSSNGSSIYKGDVLS